MARRASRLANLATVQLSVAAAIAAFALTPASAEEEGFTLDVTAKVANVCGVGFESEADGLHFGELELGDEAIASVMLKIACTFAGTARVDINTGSNADGSQRRLLLSGGAEFVPYAVCINNPFGGTCSSWDAEQQFFPVNGGSNGGTSVPVHAYISPGDTGSISQEGDYEDVLRVTVFIN